MVIVCVPCGASLTARSGVEYCTWNFVESTAGQDNRSFYGTNTGSHPWKVTGWLYKSLPERHVFGPAGAAVVGRKDPPFTAGNADAEVPFRYGAALEPDASKVELELASGGRVVDRDVAAENATD